MQYIRIFFTYFFVLPLTHITALIPDKVLICGICKDVEKAVPNTIRSVSELSAQFLDYRVIIYENNSKDNTKHLLQSWAKKDSHVIFISEDIPKKKLAKAFAMKIFNRSEALARARNIVLDEIMQKKYEDFKYVIWADLDFLEPWDVAHIVESIEQPEQDWDAILANGAYDLFALRDPEFPIGFELLGKKFWHRLHELRSRFSLNPTGPWRKVYSAFGGLGIYKRSSIQGCRYSGIVTKDLEKVVSKWLEQARKSSDVCFLKDYDQLLANHPIIDLYEECLNLNYRKKYPEEIGMRLKNSHGIGTIVWFSCTRKKSLPWTCEHIPFHASMILNGHDKIFINPRLLSHHP